MDIVKKNYDALKQFYPDIYARISDLNDYGKYRILSPNEPDGPCNLINTETGRLFYPEHNAFSALEQDCRDRNLKVKELTVFLGAGLAYQIFAFFNVYNISGGSYVIIEKDLEVFRAALHCIDLSAMFAHPCLTFIVGADNKEVFTTMNGILQRTDAKYFVKAINFIEQPTCFIENKDYYLNSIRAIKEAVREVLLFFGNDPNDSMIGIENTFHNINEIIENPGVLELKDKFKGKPGIVVATGPSLDKNIDLLHGIENKAVICVPDASLLVMRRHNLKPHMVTSLERLIPTAKLFEGLEKEDFDDVYFAGTPVIHPQTYANYKGKRIIVYRNLATFKWLNIEKGTLDIGPSAGNMAFKVLEYLGCDPIILIGQDLAFGDDGNTHAYGTTYGEKQTGEAFNNEVFVEGNYTPTVKTTKVWNMFLNYYHKDVAESKVKVINATEGGAKIFGTEIMTFREAIDKYINDDVDTLKIIRENLVVPDDDTMKEQRQMTEDNVERGLDICNRAITVFDECYRLCDKYFNEVWEPYKNGAEYNTEEAVRISAELEQKTDIFKDPDFFHVLMHYVQSYFIRCMIEVNAAKAEDCSEPDRHFKIVDTLKDMYAVMIYLVRKMEVLLVQLKKDLDEKQAGKAD